MRRKAPFSIGILLLLLIANLSCDRAPTGANEEALPPFSGIPAFAILDAANGGSAGFYFMPPSVPSAPSYNGTFDGTLAPRLRVEICQLTTGDTCVQPVVTTLTDVATDPRNRILVNAPRQFYNVYWQVPAALGGSGRVFRATVIADGIRLGFNDVSNPAAGAWVPVTFRVETGAIAAANPAPQVVITSPANGTSVLAGTAVTLTGVASDVPNGDLSAALSWSSDVQGNLGTGGTVSNVILTPGAHTITARATDSHGAVGSASINLTVAANSAPVVVITSPTAGSSYVQGSPITFNATAQDAEQGDLGASVSWSSSVDGAFGTGASVTTSALTVGPHVVTASVTDANANTSTTTVAVVVTANTPPSVTIASPATGTSVVHGTSVTFTGTATDAQDGDRTAFISWSSNLGGALGTGASVSTSALAVGTHTITANVSDTHGANAQASITLTVAANNSPVLTITSPASGSTFTAGRPVTFSATATDAEDGNLAGATSWSSDKGGNLGTGASVTTSSLSAGTHTITASVTDAHGNNATQSITITIAANQAPALQITAPANGSSHTVNATVTFTASVLDAEDGDLSANIAWSSSVAGPLGTGALITRSDLGIGTHIITATVTDSDGATTSATTTITITNTPPSVTITSPASGTSVVQGTNVTFTGIASDAQDGDRTAFISWSSDLSGALGTGGSVSTSSLAVGTHTITANITDTHGAGAQATITLTVTANNAPVLSITSPASGSNFTAGRAVMFTATATDPEDGNVAGNVTWTSDISGNLGTGSSVTTSTLSLGTHTITASVTDAHANTTSTSITVTVVANQAPALQITAPANGSSHTVNTPVTFTAQASDAEDGDVSANVAWSSDVAGPLGTGASITRSNLAIGSHIITATVTDVDGVTTTATITITITNTPPSVTITSPANGANVQHGTAVAFTGNASDVQDGDLTAAIQWSSDVSGALGTGGSITTSTLPAGPHTITASVTDTHGATTSATISITVVPNTAPVVTITAPPTGTTVNQGSSVTFTATANDAQDGDLTASISWSSNVTGALGTGGSVATTSLSPGTHVVTASATDNQGSVGSASVTITVNALPGVTITAPANGSSFPVLSQVTFSATATDPEQGDLASSISWWVDGVNLASGGSFSHSSLSVGSHTIEARVSDNQGGTASASVSITITNAAPTVSITSPAGGANIPVLTNITFSATATDPEQGDLSSSITWWVDGVNLASGGSFSHASLSVGSHTIEARVSDSHGGVATPASITITTTNAAPTVNITSPADGANIPVLTNITFTATATDPEQGDLAGSITWWVDGVNLASGGSFSHASLSVGSHTIEARVSDSHGGAATPASITITITNASPTVNITAPANGASFNVGQAINFTATATDPESGPLGSSITWSINGTQLGSGATFVYTPTAAGSLTVQASVTDAYGASGSHSIILTVVANSAPIVSINTPANGALIQAGAPVSFSGSANDLEDGNISGSLQWVSNRQGVIGSGSSFSVNLNGGAHIITATATDAGGQTGSATINITISIVSVPTTLNVPYGGTASLPITLSEPAPSGGLTLDVVSTNPGAVGVLTTSVHIPAGQQSINATLSGVSPGLATVTASNPQYGSDASQVTTTANLNIVETNVTFPAGRLQPITIRLESSGSPIAAPAGGIVVNLTATNSSCVANQQATIPAGLVSVTVDLQHGGTATLPCSTPVTASAASLPTIGTDAVNATVIPAPPITVNANNSRVGSGLMYGTWSFTLGAPAPAGGLAVTLQSADPNLLLVSPNNTTAGSASIVVNVAAGSSTGNFWVHGREGVTGTANLNVTASGYTGGVASIIVAPVLMDLQGLQASNTSLSVNDDFVVRVGAANAGNASYYAEQSVRIGGPALTFTITNSIAAVGQLVTTSTTGQSVTVSIVPGESRSPGSLATGGVQFDPSGAGSTTVAASAPNVIALPGASQTITVSAPSLSTNAGGSRVGSGLQYGAWSVGLGAPAPAGGLQVTLQSSDGNLLLLAPNNTTAGTATLVLNVAAGSSNATFWLQGVEGATGTATIDFTAPAFTGTSASVVVAPVAVDLVGLTTTTTTLTANDDFQARIGAANAANNNFYAEQTIRPGGTPLTVTVTNSAAGVGQLVTTAATGQSVTVTIAVGESRSPVNQATGGVQFDALAAGPTTVAVNGTGLILLAGASQTVTVSAPVITTNVHNSRVGSGLVYGQWSVTLGAPAPAGGLQVTLQSSNPGLLQMSTTSTTAGTGTLVLTIPANQSTAAFWVQGVENVTGSATIDITGGAAYTGTAATVHVTPVAFDLIGLNATTTTLSGSDPFSVRVGALNAASNGFYAPQAIRQGGTPLTFAITNSSALVGQLVTTPVTGQAVSVTVPVGATQSPSTVAAGGVAFDPLGSGPTDVTASNSSPTLTALAGASQRVTVSAPAITTNVGGSRVGSGLQYGTWNFTLGAPAPAGGVDVLIQSSAGGVLQVAPNGTTAGTTSLIVHLAAGQTNGNFWVQGVEGATGTATLTFSANGFTNGTAAVDVVPVAVDIILLGTTHTAAGADDPFQVRIGAVNAAGNAFYAEQTIRAGGTALTLNVTNSNAAAAQLITTAGAAQTRTVSVAVGLSRSATTVAGGGIALDPLGIGQSIVNTFAGGVISLPGASVTVNIN